MQEVIFHLQTITPLFMAGADQRKIEIREPSFRGDMRYWYRAMVGGLFKPGPEALKLLEKAESSVFGATDKGSAIQIRIMDRPTELSTLSKEGTGRDYLFWSVLRSNRQCFSSGTQFRVALSIHNHEREKQASAVLRQGVSAFWLLTQLGGIGSRARRCGGSLMVTRVIGDTFDLPFNPPASAPELQKILQQGIAKSRAFYDSDKRANILSTCYDVLAPETCKIYILLKEDGNPWEDADQALRDIGESLRLSRESIKGSGSSAKRIASPLHLRLSALQTSDGQQYVGVATLFKTRWKDMSEREFELYHHIEDWREKEFHTALEVQL